MNQQMMEILLSDNVSQNIRDNEECFFDLFPELKVCKGFDQKNSWHVYDVYEHILHVLEGVAPKRILRITALFHDMGKPAAFTVDDQGVGHFYGHWERSTELFQKYEPLLNLPKEEANLIRWLIFYHDVNVDRLTEDELLQMVHSIGSQNLGFLFDVKRADLLAQSPVYWGTMAKIQDQEQRILERFQTNN